MNEMKENEEEKNRCTKQQRIEKKNYRREKEEIETKPNRRMDGRTARRSIEYVWIAGEEEEEKKKTKINNKLICVECKRTVVGRDKAPVLALSFVWTYTHTHTECNWHLPNTHFIVAIFIFQQTNSCSAHFIRYFGPNSVTQHAVCAMARTPRNMVEHIERTENTRWWFVWKIELKTNGQ